MRNIVASMTRVVDSVLGHVDPGAISVAARAWVTPPPHSSVSVACVRARKFEPGPLKQAFVEDIIAN